MHVSVTPARKRETQRREGQKIKGEKKGYIRKKRRGYQSAYFRNFREEERGTTAKDANEKKKKMSKEGEGVTARFFVEEPKKEENPRSVPVAGGKRGESGQRGSRGSYLTQGGKKGGKRTAVGNRKKSKNPAQR